MTHPAPTTTPSAATPSNSSTATSPAVDEVVVRRDVRRSLRIAAIGAAGISIVLFWMPALIVVIRTEPGYFTGGILWTALIATTLLIALMVAGTLLWMRTGGRDQPILRLGPDGVRIRAHRDTPAFEATWSSLALVRVIGHSEPELAFYPRADEAATEPTPEQTELDLSEPEFLRPLDFQNDPPPPTIAPERDVFTHITPVAPEDEAPQESPAPPSGAQNLHATPHVVAVHRTTPPLPEVLRAIRRYADGRVALG